MIAHSLLVTTHRDNLDGRKVRNSSGKVNGKPCGKTYISASYKCSKHYGKNGRLNALGKQQLMQMAKKARSRRGLTSGRSKAAESVLNTAPKLKRFGLTFEGSYHKDKLLKNAFKLNGKNYVLTESFLGKALVAEKGSGHTISQAKQLKLYSELFDLFGEHKVTASGKEKPTTKPKRKGVNRSLEFDMYDPRGRYYG